MWTTTFHLNKKLPGPDIMSPVLITITLAFETSHAAFSQAIAFPEASEASHHALNAFPHAGLLDSTGILLSLPVISQYLLGASLRFMLVRADERRDIAQTRCH